MPKLTELEQRIREDWPETSDPLPLRMLRALADLKGDAADYVTLPLFVQLLTQRATIRIISSETTQEFTANIFRYAQYLTALGAIDAGYELLRDDGSSVLVDGETVAEALSSGELIDPDSGTPISDWQSHVIPYYSARRLLRDLRGR